MKSAPTKSIACTYFTEERIETSCGLYSSHLLEPFRQSRIGSRVKSDNQLLVLTFVNVSLGVTCLLEVFICSDRS